MRQKIEEKNPKILKLKNTINEPKNSLKAFNNRLEEAEEESAHLKMGHLKLFSYRS